MSAPLHRPADRDVPIRPKLGQGVDGDLVVLLEQQVVHDLARGVLQRGPQLDSGGVGTKTGDADLPEVGIGLEPPGHTEGVAELKAGPISLRPGIPHIPLHGHESAHAVADGQHPQLVASAERQARIGRNPSGGPCGHIDHHAVLAPDPAFGGGDETREEHTGRQGGGPEPAGRDECVAHTLPSAQLVRRGPDDLAGHADARAMGPNEHDVAVLEAQIGAALTFQEIVVQVHRRDDRTATPYGHGTERSLLGRAARRVKRGHGSRRAGHPIAGRAGDIAGHEDLNGPQARDADGELGVRPSAALDAGIAAGEPRVEQILEL